MAVQQVVASEVGLTGVYPKLIYIKTNDTLSGVSRTGYLNKAAEMNPTQILSGDMAIITTTDRGTIYMRVLLSGGNWSLIYPETSGIVTNLQNTVDIAKRTTTSATPVATGITLSITPRSASSRIILSANGIVGWSAGSSCAVYFYRGVTSLLPVGSTSIMSASSGPAVATRGVSFYMSFTDAPATTSAVTYNLYFSRAGSGTVSLGGVAASATVIAPTVFTAMEVLV